MPISEAYNMDCMDYMRQFPDKHFELAVVDPPYGIGEDGSKNDTRGNYGALSRGVSKAKRYKGFAVSKAKRYKGFAGGDKKPETKEYFLEVRRVSKHQIIFGANHFIDQMPYGTSSPCWLVWDKLNGETDFADCELAWTSFKSAVRKFTFKWNGLLQGDMKNKEHRIHPTQKPVALYKWIFENYAQPGWKILDTHLGSGSSRIAAWDMGLDFYATELDPDYFAAMEKRFQAHIARPQLFAPSEQYTFKQASIFEDL